MKVRRGDSVIVIAGNDKGRTGVVKQVQVEENRVIVEGINLRWRHRRPTQQNPKGERIQSECAIHASNVMLLDPATGKGTRHRPEADKGARQRPAAAKTKGTKSRPAAS